MSALRLVSSRGPSARRRLTHKRHERVYAALRELEEALVDLLEREVRDGDTAGSVWLVAERIRRHYYSPLQYVIAEHGFREVA